MAPDTPDYLKKKPGQLHPRYAEAFDQVTFWASRFGALLFDHLELRGGITGLDVGCATGFPLFELAETHGPSSRFVGIDIWKEAIDEARTKLEIYGLPNVELLDADAAAMPFSEDAFDLITSNLGLNNFERPAAALAECFRVARGGARIVLTTNLSGHMAEMYDLLRRVLVELSLEDRIEALDVQERHRGTDESVAALLTSAGFRISRRFRSEFPLRFADGSAMLRHGLVKFFLDGWRPVFAGADEAMIFSWTEQRLNEIAADRGGLSFGIPMLYIEAIKPT
jgi:arsenite methyltransferase